LILIFHGKSGAYQGERKIIDSPCRTTGERLVNPFEPDSIAAFGALGRR